MSFRILIIDDDPGVREMLGDLFSREGFEVSLAENGKQGLCSYRECRADLVITDIIMPEKEGLETIMALRAEDPQVRIFAISGGSRNVPIQFLEASKKLGALRAFSKPFDCQDLLSAVKTVLSS